MNMINTEKNQKVTQKKKLKVSQPSNGQPQRTLGPISDLERHLPPEWWKTLFNSLYLKTDGDVVENSLNTETDVDMIIKFTNIKSEDRILDLCCGQGRHSLELAKRGFRNVTGVDRSRYLIRLARKRAKAFTLPITFSEGDARQFRLKDSSIDCVVMMGNSFGYFEREEDDIAVLNNLKRILTSNGKLLLDIVDGSWMSQNFEPRSWEWIDKNHFVNRERSLSTDGKRVISREVITNAEIGVMADQFYAERLYSLEEITTILADLGFDDIQNHGNVYSHSTRNQDLGMMANRLFITARAPEKKRVVAHAIPKLQTTVIMGDPKQPDRVKKNGQFNPEDIETIAQLKQSLKTLDEFQFQYLDNHQTLLSQLIKSPPTFVFNLCDEGYNNKAEEELHIPALLEMLKIPYTGAGPTCLALCYNKSFIRSVASSLDVPVPLETYYTPSDQAAHIPHTFPAIIKPNCGDSSIGITQNAVVQNAEELIDYINYLNELLPGVPLLIQEFLEGTEYTVGLIGNPGKFEALPLLEVDFSDLPENLPKILSYESKWLPDSAYWNKIRYKEADLPDETARKLIDYSQALFERLECRDYARFDFRADSNGDLKLLEVNPNPGWCWDGKFNLMASLGGLSYSQFLEQILKAAKERLGL